MPRRFADPLTVRRDLERLSMCYHVERIKLLGGEPLLHPALLEVIDVVVQSRIGDKICVVTNGVVLPRMGRDFWSAVDEVWISSYPGFELSAEHRRACWQQAREHNVKLQWERCPTFREAYAALGTSDRALVQRIFSTCQVAHEWRCHTVVDGYFFKCPQSYYLPKRLGPFGAEPCADALELSAEPGFREKLLAYLESPAPMLSCSRCLGTVGRRFEHQQIARRGWAEVQDHTTEELLDRRLLAKEEQMQRFPVLRRLQTALPNSGNRAKVSA